MTHILKKKLMERILSEEKDKVIGYKCNDCEHKTVKASEMKNYL